MNKHVKNKNTIINKELGSELDNYGPLTEPWKKGDPIYDFRALLKYCEEKGVEPHKLPDEERDKFIIEYYE